MKALFAILGTNLAFLLFPNPLIFAFSASFLSGEFWRILTFHFAHLNLAHFSQNFLALAFTGVLAAEVGMNEQVFLALFFIPSILLALLSLLIPGLILLGSSIGIFSLLGALSIQASRFVPTKVLLPVFAAFALFGEGFQVLFHLSGLFLGFLGFSLLKRRRKKILC